MMAAEIEIALASRINDHHSLAVTQANSAVENAIITGQLLVEAKSSVKHGEWTAWIADHLTFGDRHARKYMQIFDGRSAIEQNGHAVADLGINSFLKVLKPPKPSPSPTPNPKSTEAPDEDQQVAEIESSATGEAPELVPGPLIGMKAALDPEDLHAANEIKRLTAEVAVITNCRDGYMNGKNEMLELLESRDCQIKRLKAELTQCAVKIDGLTRTIEVLRSTPQVEPDTDETDNRLAAALARGAQADSFREQLASRDKRLKEVLAEKRELEEQVKALMLKVENPGGATL